MCQTMRQHLLKDSRFTKNVHLLETNDGIIDYNWTSPIGTYKKFTVLYSRKQLNTVNQLYSNKKK